MTAELKEEDRELLKSAIKSAEKIAEVKMPPSTPPEPTSDEGERKSHKSHTLENVLDCPDCYPKLRDRVFKKEAQNLKEAELVCEDCGLPVEESDDECLWCGGKDAKRK